jgi:DEP domain-containing protein 5
MHTASHVEICFRNQYLTRSDMWRLAISELSNGTVYKGQKILFLESIKAWVKNIYVRGKRVKSAYFAAGTKPIFRSESARFVIFVQMSKEMWHFDAEGTGEIMFNKVVNGFLPDLFKRWSKLKAQHLVSIVLFTRVEYEGNKATGPVNNTGPGLQPATGNTSSSDTIGNPFRDFFRVVVSNMDSGDWSTILYKLKREFTVFLRDILIQPLTQSSKGMGWSDMAPDASDRPESVISGIPTAALHGNVLEAINLASSQFSQDHIDRDLLRTGISIVVITPGVGLFEVDYKMLQVTTENLVANSIGIDLVCLSKMPLHSVPLFKYKNPEVHSSSIPGEAINSSMITGSPSARTSVFGSYSSRISLSSPSRISEYSTSPRVNPTVQPTITGEWSYAVPHWIDVSFWTGKGEVSSGTMRTHKDVHAKHSHRKERREFTARCRMYELQMMGIMEDEISNIAIAYLHDNPFYMPFPFSSLTSHVQGRRGGDPNSSVQGSLSRLATPAAPRPYNINAMLTSAATKTERQLGATKEEKDALKWMDEYDEWLFKPQAQVQNAIRHLKHSRKNEEDQRIKQKLREDDPLLFGTSFNDGGHSPGALNFPAGTTYFDRKMKESRLFIDKQMERRDSVGSIVPSSAAVQGRPTRLARQISFGLRGFNVGAPKATAAPTELRTEHARPGPLLTRGFRTKAVPAEAISNNASPSPISVKGARDLSPTSSTFRENGSSVPDSERKRDALYDVQEGLKVREGTPSQPIAIKKPVEPQHNRPNSIVGSVFDASTADREKGDSERIDILQAASMTKQAGPKLDLMSTIPATVTSLSPTSALSPWITILNPSNPTVNLFDAVTRLRRWQHVYPRPLRTSSMKWKSLCSPAALPLTTEYFPTAEQLANEYQENPYSMSQVDDDDLNENPNTREELMMELIALRLSRGFQIVIGPAVAEATNKPSLKIVDIFDKKFVSHEGAMVFMSLGNTIHQLLCVDGSEVEIKRYIRKPSMAVSTSTYSDSSALRIPYQPQIRTTLDEKYEPRTVMFQPPALDYNWNYVDSFIAGYEDTLSEQLRFWRARFILIPADLPQSTWSRGNTSTDDKDTDEEIRLEGIRRLTQLWQRHRLVPIEERSFQGSTRKGKDPNPLDIVYKTRDPSVVITAEVDAYQLLETEPNTRKSQLFSSSDQFQKSNLNLQALAQEIQGEKGVKMQDRRWHLRLHYNCFIGSEMTTWLLHNFKDVDTREDAIELGNYLMVNGLFQHVERRHQFRDGNFFYQLAGEYSTRPQSSSWFNRQRYDRSIPSTPMSEPKDSPYNERSRSSSTTDDSTNGGIATPTASRKRLKVALSKVMKYDVDYRKRSYRPEIINLHYDRLHNPDNCYHIRIDWLNTTSKLIEDALSEWARIADKYGLRLIEAPIDEACAITEMHTFRRPVMVKLVTPPPGSQPLAYFEPTSFGPSHRADSVYYHKAILRKHGFFLDIEAAKNFPSDVDVTYSWGKPDYRYSQYVHQSGVLFAQITDDGDFLLLANRLFNSRTNTARDQHHSSRFDRQHDHADRHNNYSIGVGFSGVPAHARAQNSTGTLAAPDTVSGHPSPMVQATGGDSNGMSGLNNGGRAARTPEIIWKELETFCSDEGQLKRFYDEELNKEKVKSPGASDTLASLVDINVPQLGPPLRKASGSES